MVDTVARVLRRPYAIPQIEEGKQPSRHGNNKEDTEHRFGLEQDEAEQYGTDCTRRPKAVIIRVFALLKHGTHITQYKAEDIKQGKMDMPPWTQANKYGFKGEAEEVKRKHVEQQVCPIAVDKATG